MYNSSGHSSGVMSVAFSPDGKTIVSGSGDNSIKIWQLERVDDVQESQNLAVNVGETAMLRAILTKKDEELQKKEEELQKKEEELQKICMMISVQD
jgi:WD40 repeat protein